MSDEAPHSEGPGDPRSRLVARWLRQPPSVWLAVAWLVFVAGRCLVPMDETDLFFNLRLGEIILSGHTIPRTNLLSFTYPDHADPNLAWVFQIILALVHRAGGIPGTVLLKTAFVGATFALLWRVALRRGAHPMVAAAVGALAAWAAEPRFVERPHLVTFLGLALLLCAVDRAERDKPKLLFAMVPLGLLWANGNSGFFLAPTLLFLYAAGAALDGRRSDALRATAVGALMAPLILATPSGLRALSYIANHFRMPSLRPLQEYRPAEWPLDGPFFFLAAAVAIVSVLPRPRAAIRTAAASESPPPTSNRGNPPGMARHLIPVVTLAALGSKRIRFVAEFALVAFPFVAERLTTLAHAWVRTSLREKDRPTAAASLSIANIFCAVALLGLVVWPRYQSARAGDAVVNLGMEAGLVPFEAIHWLDTHQLRDRLYNDLEVGSYLAWQGWPRHRVFQDPRINGYPSSFHALLRRQDVTRTEWETLLGHFGVNAALISFPSVNPRAALFDPQRWALVYRASDALVFVRRAPSRPDAVLRTVDIIRDNEIPVSFQFDSASGVTPLPLLSRPAASPLPDCEWRRRLASEWLLRRDVDRAWATYREALQDGVGCFPARSREEARRTAGALALRFSDPGRAAELLDGLTDAPSIANRAFALIQLDDPAEALRLFEGALAQAPGNAEAEFGRGLALARVGRSNDARHALSAFVTRWPKHFAAARAKTLLAQLPH